MKSIILFGKGPSVTKCTKEIVDQYDDIAICNYPLLNDFFYNLIDNREIKYHFANCGDPDGRHNNNVVEKLKIKNIINTNTTNNYIKIIKNKDLFVDSIHYEYNKYFREKFDLNPSTGIKGLQYIINTNEYNKILLVGIDNFKKGEQTYYFNIKDLNPSLKKYIGKAYTKEGIYNQVSEHNPDKTEIYLNSLKTSYPDIEIKNINN